MTRETANHSKQPKLLDVDMLPLHTEIKDYEDVRDVLKKLLQIEKSFHMMSMKNCNVLIKKYLRSNTR